MYKRLYCVLWGGLFISYMGQARADDSNQWVLLDQSDKNAIFVKKGSFEIPKNKEGIPVALVIVKKENKVTNTIDFSKWKISVSDCMDGYGKLNVTDMRDQVKASYDYVAKGGSVATVVGDLICEMAIILIRDYQKKEALKK
ncbi:MAG: hypothetical protein IV103_20195 [Zoogloea sp.]|nr:hypothetical protein [Zoogloea sp.]